MREHLVRVRTHVPGDLSDEAWSAIVAAERIRGAELREVGVIRMIWRIPSNDPHVVENVGIWRAADATAVEAFADTLPARQWMQVEITPLDQHPLMSARSTRA